VQILPGASLLPSLASFPAPCSTPPLSCLNSLPPLASVPAPPSNLPPVFPRPLQVCQVWRRHQRPPAHLAAQRAGGGGGGKAASDCRLPLGVLPGHRTKHMLALELRGSATGALWWCCLCWPAAAFAAGSLCSRAVFAAHMPLQLPLHAHTPACLCRSCSNTRAQWWARCRATPTLITRRSINLLAFATACARQCWRRRREGAWAGE
jgi:hypothetical protein